MPSVATAAMGVARGRSPIRCAGHLSPATAGGCGSPGMAAPSGGVFLRTFRAEVGRADYHVASLPSPVPTGASIAVQSGGGQALGGIAVHPATAVAAAAAAAVAAHAAVQAAAIARQAAAAVPAWAAPRTTSLGTVATGPPVLVLPPSSGGVPRYAHSRSLSPPQPSRGSAVAPPGSLGALSVVTAATLATVAGFGSPQQAATPAPELRPPAYCSALRAASFSPALPEALQVAAEIQLPAPSWRRRAFSPSPPAALRRAPSPGAQPVPATVEATRQRTPSPAPRAVQVESSGLGFSAAAPSTPVPSQAGRPVAAPWSASPVTPMPSQVSLRLQSPPSSIILTPATVSLRLQSPPTSIALKPAALCKASEAAAATSPMQPLWLRGRPVATARSAAAVPSAADLGSRQASLCALVPPPAATSLAPPASQARSQCPQPVQTQPPWPTGLMQVPYMYEPVVRSRAEQLAETQELTLPSWRHASSVAPAEASWLPRSLELPVARRVTPQSLVFAELPLQLQLRIQPQQQHQEQSLQQQPTLQQQQPVMSHRHLSPQQPQLQRQELSPQQQRQQPEQLHRSQQPLQSQPLQSQQPHPVPSESLGSGDLAGTGACHGNRKQPDALPEASAERGHPAAPDDSGPEVVPPADAEAAVTPPTALAPRTPTRTTPPQTPHGSHYKGTSARAALAAAMAPAAAAGQAPAEAPPRRRPVPRAMSLELEEDGVGGASPRPGQPSNEIAATQDGEPQREDQLPGDTCSVDVERSMVDLTEPSSIAHQPSPPNSSRLESDPWAARRMPVESTSTALVQREVSDSGTLAAAPMCMLQSQDRWTIRALSDESPAISPRMLLVYSPTNTMGSRGTFSSIASPLRTPLCMSPARSCILKSLTLGLLSPRSPPEVSATAVAVAVCSRRSGGSSGSGGTGGTCDWFPQLADTATVAAAVTPEPSRIGSSCRSFSASGLLSGSYAGASAQRLGLDVLGGSGLSPRVPRAGSLGGARRSGGAAQATQWRQLYLDEVGQLPDNANQFRAFVINRGGDIPYCLARRALQR